MIWKEEATAFSDCWNGMLGFDFLSVVSVRISPPKAYQLRSCLDLPPMGKLARAPSRIEPPVYENWPHLLKAILLLDAKIEGDTCRYFLSAKGRFIAYTPSGHGAEVFSRFC